MVEADTLFRSVLVVHYLATLIMTGAIWLAQLSTYPLLAYVGRRHFIQYEHEHVRRISTIAWTMIYLELVTGLMLLFAPRTLLPVPVTVTGGALILLIWSATWLVQYPIHKRLERGFDKALYRRLVRTNWIRTVAWTLLTLIWTGMIFTLIRFDSFPA